MQGGVLVCGARAFVVRVLGYSLGKLNSNFNSVINSVIWEGDMRKCCEVMA